MTSQTIQYRAKKSIGAGIIGGIAGGAAMYGIMSVLMSMIGMGPNCFAIIMGLITGQSYEAALGPGIAAHFGTSIAIGAIFGAIVSTPKLQIMGFKKGIALGTATGIIAYVVIFLPVAMTAMPPHMMDLMKMMPMQGNMMPEKGMTGSSTGNSSMNGQGAIGNQGMKGTSTEDEKMKMEEMDKMIMEQSQKIMPSILGGSFASHIIFGVVLGAVTTAIVRRT
jgi:hypothetical protein